MSETDIIKRYFSWHKVDQGIGVGDDAAVLPFLQKTIATVDTFHEGKHFPYGADAAKVATKVWLSSVSDVVAMGAVCKYALLSLTLPDINHKWLEKFSRSLRESMQDFQCVLVGGDLTSGNLCISLTCLGEENNPILLSGARVGNIVLVTGSLGDACAFYKDIDTSEYFEKSFYYPHVRKDFMRLAKKYCSSATDISDGILVSLDRISTQSGVGISLQEECLPISDQLAVHSEAKDCALYGGDDYQLCITTDRKNLKDLQSIAKQCNTPLSRIGEVIKEKGVQGYKIQGYDHFA